MIRGVLFDLDGTLLDRELSLRDFLDRQYERFPVMHNVSKPRFVERFLQLDENGYVWKDKVYASLIEQFGWPCDPAELLNDYLYTFRDHCVGFPYLTEMLDELKGMGVKLGIVSNGFDAFQRSNLSGLGITDDFDAILVSESEGLRKPDPAIFMRALQRLNLAPEETMFVGDHPVNDVEAGVRAGLLGVWKKNAVYAMPECSCLILDDLMQIPAWARARR
ncbi:HAD family hydrolase [Saccharibacillus endophyticus]|uniref:Haloacid dehalogenase n=1 Tax=Saccharibacillus endophyticus TaxID=2060666 RepID=A0ABQ1ZLR8_9BACL|nr:HAD family hydrolase [Saccharibacillus endophyticus]GGH68580.1 haloacid dehalogenase [Saccharibacillus endophyticus]